MAVALDPAIRSVPAKGRLIVLLGPSGSGKDTLISAARAAFARSADVLFVRRAITRSADPDSEDYVAMSEAEFDAAIDEGRFSLTWSANGLRYGLPRDIAAHLEAGKVAVVNGSRGAWSVIRQVFPAAVAVEIRVEPEILARRLRARGRESASEIEARLARASELAARIEPELVIDNSGPVEVAQERLIDYIDRSIAG